MSDRRLAERRFHSPGAQATIHRCICWLAAVVMFVGAGVAQAAPFIGSGSGLLGAYCNRYFWNETVPCDGSPDVTRIDAIVDFSSGDGDWPASGIDDDTFSVRWTGQVQAQYTEDYTFHALHDDGVRVWVDGTLVIDNYDDQDDAWTDSNNPISLQRGQGYDIIIEYYENRGEQDMRLAWSSASTPLRTTIPQTQLYPDEATSGNPLAAYRFDESAWNGTSGQVIDASGNGRDGTAQGGADTTSADPAISGDPGTCGYGTFDGSNDYVSVSNLSDTLNGTATLAFWVRTTQSGSSTAYQSPGITGVEEAGGTDDIFWGWIDGSGRIGISVANDFDAEQKSTTAINDGTWHHVALTRDANGGETRVYVDGTLESTGSTPTGTIGNAFESIGRIEDTGGSPEYFRGDLDEVRIYDRVLDVSEVQTVYNDTHACPATPAGGSCSATFPSAVQNTANAGSINLEYGAQVIDPDNLLETITLNDNVGYGNTSCGGTDCMATTPLATVPNVPTFQTASGNNDVDTQGRPRSFALGEDGETDYDQVQIRNNETLNDSGNFSTYRINDLQLNFRSTWNLAGGADYYVNNLTLGTRTEINVTGSGTARLFVRGSVTFPFDSTVNLGGAPDRLIIVGYNDVTVDTGNAQPVNALVYAQGDVSLGFQDQVNGAVAAAGSVSVGNSAQVTYDQGAVSDVDDRGFCVGSEPMVDHYAISVGSGAASTCQPRKVIITAEDSAGQTLTNYTGTVNLEASSGNGTWSVADADGILSDTTADDGTASYAFVESDNGTIELQLANQHADDLTVTVTESDGAPSSTSSVVSFRHNAFVIEPRSALANKANDDLVAGLDQPFQATLVRRDPPTPAGECGIATNYNESSQDVKLWVERHADDPGGNAPKVNGASLPDGAPVSTNITLDFSAGTLGQAGRALFTLETSDVGKYALMIEDTTFAEDESGNPRPITGGSPDYVVRPFGLRLTANGNPAAVSATGPVYLAAGTDFDVTVAGVVYDSADDDGGENGTAYDGIPDGHNDTDASAESDLSDNNVTPSFGRDGASVEVTSALVAPSGGTWQPLDGGEPLEFTDFAGASTRSTSWPEVGIIELAATVSNYLDSGRSLEGRSGEVGRFKPKEFTQTAMDGAFEKKCSDAFTYIGQEFGYATGMVPELTITARNADDETTTNYTGAFAKLTRDDIERGLPTADDSEDGRDGTLLPVTSNVSQGTLTDNADGTLTYLFDDTDTFTYDRDIDRDTDGQNDARIAPFDAALTITIDAIEDSDNVAAPAANREDVKPAPTTELRFGRLAIGNVYGPETEDLTLALQAEYFDGNRFTGNSADSCTPLSITGEANHARLQLDDDGTWVRADEPADLNGGSGGTTSGTGVTGLAGGVGTLTLAAPGAGNTGSASVRADLTDFLWLRGDWDDDGSYDDFPSGLATFGVYRGNDRIIYWQEVLN